MVEKRLRNVERCTVLPTEINSIIPSPQTNPSLSKADGLQDYLVIQGLDHAWLS